MKTCTKCDVQYAEESEAFAKNVRATDGLQAHCKKCMSKANKDRREKAKVAANAEKARAKRQAYMRDYNEKYRKANHSHKLDLTQQWRVRQAGGVVVEEVDRAIVLYRAEQLEVWNNVSVTDSAFPVPVHFTVTATTLWSGPVFASTVQLRA